MENIKIELSVELIKKGLETAASELFKNSYSNPIKDILEKSIKEKEGQIKQIVDGIIADALTNPDFKSRISEAVITSLVSAALKK